VTETPSAQPAEPIDLELVTSNRRLEEVIEEQEAHDTYAIDTEFANQRTYYPRLSLVQIAWPDRVVLIDPFVVDCRLLQPLLEGPALAIAHSAQNDLEVLDHSLGLRPSHLFDTQIAALLLNSEGLSLQHLTSTMLGVTLDKAQQNQDWTRRPLTDRALQYAASDVVYLFELADQLRTGLEQRSRQGALEEECAALLQASFIPLEPERAWWRISGRETIPGEARLFAAHLAKVREELAEQLDVPKRKLLRDEHLIVLATNPPRSLGNLKSRLNRTGIEDRDIPLFFQAIEDARNGVDAHLVATERSGEREDLRPIISKLQKVVTEIATREEINQGFLASRKDLIARLTGEPSKLDAAWRKPIVTEPIDETIALWREDPAAALRTIETEAEPSQDS
jgi:ribonuclease D